MAHSTSRRRSIRVNGQLPDSASSWLDLDLPDAIALRRRFFTNTARRSMIVASVVDEGWVETARELPGPFFLVAEASLGYLSPADAHRAISLIAEHFSGSQLAFDTCGGSSRSRTSTTCSRTSSG